MNESSFKVRFCAKAAFTLIELLVVVLIAGILAAVALPQYNKAINKSRVAEIETNLVALARAAQACELEKDRACETNDLDIEMPECKPLPGTGASCWYGVMNGFSHVNFNYSLFFYYKYRYAMPGETTPLWTVYCQSSSKCSQYGFTVPIPDTNDKYLRP